MHDEKQYSKLSKSPVWIEESKEASFRFVSDKDLCEKYDDSYSNGIDLN